MKIKIVIAKPIPEDIVSSVYVIETREKCFVEELKKYTCPMRLLTYLDEVSKNIFTDLATGIKDEDCDLIIDLSEKFESIISKNTKNGDFVNSFAEPYIESTPYLDKYGIKF